MLRTAFVDDVQAAKDFAAGDVVRKTDFRGFLPSPYAGRVTYVDVRSGTVQVQWPWGSEQEYPTELIRDASRDVVPPMRLDQDYSSWSDSRWFEDAEVRKADKRFQKQAAAVAARYERETLPLWRAACRAHHAGADEVSAFRDLSARFASEFGSEAVRLTVANLYAAAAAGDPRVALYWRDHGRRYKVTQREKRSGKLKCPRCGQWNMKPRTYRAGKKVIACKDCGFSISPKDLIWDDPENPKISPDALPAVASVRKAAELSLLRIAGSVSDPLLGHELSASVRALAAMDEEASGDETASEEREAVVNPGVVTWQDHVEEMLSVLKALDQELGQALTDYETAEEFAKFFEGGIAEEDQLKDILKRTKALGKVASRTAAEEETSGFGDFFKNMKKKLQKKDPDADPDVMGQPGYSLSDKAMDEFVEGSREWVDASKYVENEFKENKDFFSGVALALSDMDKLREMPTRDGVRALRDRVMALVKAGKGVLDNARRHFKSPAPLHTKQEEDDVDLGWTVQHYIEMLRESLSDPEKMKSYLRKMFEDLGPSLKTASVPPAKAQARRVVASLLVRLAKDRPAVRPVVLPILARYAGRSAA